MSLTRQDRSFNIVDGTYVMVPHINKNPERGLREFNSSVLVHNWYEERNKFEKKELPHTTSYKLDYKPYPSSKPDILIRRKAIGASEGVGAKNLIGMHNFDSSKNMISMYDETLNRRGRFASQLDLDKKFPETREWKMISDAWVPEKTDFPLQDKPTQWGLIEKKRNEIIRENDKYASQLPNLSEYNDRFQKHPSQSYLQRSTLSIPKSISTSFYDINKTLNHQLKPRDLSGSLREPQARDVMDSVYNEMLVKSNKVPRTFYYLGKIPTNGLLDVYSMKDFETLTPMNDSSKMSKPNESSNKNTDLSAVI